MSDLREYIQKALASGFMPEAVLTRLVNHGHSKEELIPLIKEEGEKLILQLEKQRDVIKKNPQRVVAEILASILFFSIVGSMLWITVLPALFHSVGIL